MQKNKILVKIGGYRARSFLILALLISFGLLTYHPMTKYYPFTRMHILLVLIIIALVACKKDHDNSDPNKTYVLSKVHSDGRVMATFEYNDQHQLIKKTYSTKVTRTSYATDESRFYYGTDARLSRVEWTSTTVTT